MKRKSKAFSLVAIFLALSLVAIFLIFRRGYKEPSSYITQTRLMMGTTVTIKAEAFPEDIQKALGVMEKVDSLMNDYDPQSEISILNKEGKAKVSPELKEVITRAVHFSRLTKGAFDITVGPLVRFWQKMEKEKRIPTQKELEDVLSVVGYQNIKVKGDTIVLGKKGMMLDVGGIAKGYAVDKAIEVLKKRGVKNALVDAGGDLYCLGEGPHGKWRIGIQHPRKMKEIVGVVEVKDRGVATSGDYRRYYSIKGKRFGHIINPATGWTVQDTPSSVTIIAPDATSADALATGVFVLGLKEGMNLINSLTEVEGMIISDDMEVLRSGGWEKFEVRS